MSRILGIETSSELCSVAVLADGNIIEDTRKMTRLHNEHVLALIDEVMRRAGIKASALDGIAFGCGPGSFTGVRIAAAVAQGIAFGAGASVLPVSSPLALATAACAKLEPAGLVTAIRSRREAFYLATYRCETGHPEPHRDVRLLEACPDWPEIDDPQWCLAGSTPPWLADRMRAADGVAVTGRIVAELGSEALARGDGLAPERGLPTYVDGDSPWRPVE